jgi:hypothetical protein
MGKSRYVSSEDVRRNAKAGAGGGQNWLKLPDGTRQWAPEASGRVLINILPYEVTSENHPDGIDAGKLWYKYPFAVHHSVGANNISIVCPGSIGQACPICQEKQRLKGKDVDEDTLKSLNPQRYVAYNMVDPDDEDKIAVLVMSRGKFAVALESEIDEGEDEILGFYHVDKSGKTLKVRFSDAEFMGKKYLEATRIDFIDREAMDEDEILKKVVNLDEMLVVLPFDKIKSLFLQTEEEEDEDEDEPKKKSSKPAKDEDKDDDEDDEDEKPSKKSKSDEDDDEDEDDEDDKPKKKATVVLSKDKKKSKDEDDDEDEDDEEKPKSKKKDEDEDEPKKKSKSDDDDEDEDEDEPKKKSKSDDDDEDEDEDEPKSKKCPTKGGTFGKDVDKYDACDDCPLWDACEEAHKEMKKSKDEPKKKSKDEDEDDE